MTIPVWCYVMYVHIVRPTESSTDDSFSNNNLYLAVPNRVSVNVKGKGLMADIYRTLATQFDPNTDDSFVVDAVDCLPNPRLPDYYIYKVVGRWRCIDDDIMMLWGTAARRLKGSCLS